MADVVNSPYFGNARHLDQLIRLRKEGMGLSSVNQLSPEMQQVVADAEATLAFQHRE
jgi:hypothetical protein